MKKEITKEMVTKLNEYLKEVNCIFRLERRTDGIGTAFVYIVLANNKYVSSYIINPTEEFYDLLNDYFLPMGIKLNWNNTRTVFWAI